MSNTGRASAHDDDELLTITSKEALMVRGGCVNCLGSGVEGIRADVGGLGGREGAALGGLSLPMSPGVAERLGIPSADK
jgi:hypothetical protein